MTVRALAGAGHTVYAGMRDIGGRNAEAADGGRATPANTASTCGPSRWTCRSGLGRRRRGRCSPRRPASTSSSTTPAHGAGPAEAFTPEQVAAVYDTNVLSTQRVNRAVLPHHARATRRPGAVGGFDEHPRRHTAVSRAVLRGQGRRGFARGQLRRRITRFGVDTTIVVPGSFTTGTNHFANAGHAGGHRHRGRLRSRVRRSDGPGRPQARRAVAPRRRPREVARRS